MEDKSKINSCLTKSIMLGSFAFGIMSFILPIYSKSIGGSALAIGGLFSIISFVTLILRPFIGRGIDKYGRKAFLVSGFLLYAVSMLMFSFSFNMHLLYASRLIQALGSSFMWIPAYSIAIDIAEDKNRGKAMGQVDGASSRGQFYGFFIGFIILGHFTFMTGWNIMFKCFAVLSAISAYIAYKYIPETKTIKAEENVKHDKAMNSNLFKLLCIVFIGSISASMLSPLLMIYLQDRFTNSVMKLANAFLPSALVYAFLPPVLGGICDKRGRIVPMIIGLIASGIVSIAIPCSGNIIILVVLWTLEALGAVMASPAEEALVADIAGEDNRGFAYGLYMFAGSLGASVGPLAGGWLYDSAGHAVPFLLNGGILLFNALLVVILFRDYKKDKIRQTQTAPETLQNL